MDLYNLYSSNSIVKWPKKKYVAVSHCEANALLEQNSDPFHCTEIFMMLSKLNFNTSHKPYLNFPRRFYLKIHYIHLVSSILVVCMMLQVLAQEEELESGERRRGWRK
jgi:hypothetical protein